MRTIFRQKTDDTGDLMISQFAVFVLLHRHEKWIFRFYFGACVRLLMRFCVFGNIYNFLETAAEDLFR